jgi:hypothetical protein
MVSQKCGYGHKFQIKHIHLDLLPIRSLLLAEGPPVSPPVLHEEIKKRILLCSIEDVVK